MHKQEQPLGGKLDIIELTYLYKQQTMYGHEQTI